MDEQHTEIKRLQAIAERAKRAMKVGTAHHDNGFYDGIQTAADYILNNADDNQEFTEPNED